MCTVVSLLIEIFNDALNPFYLLLYGVGYMVKDYNHKKKQKQKTLPLAARDILYTLSHRQGNTYYGFWYTSCGGQDRIEGLIINN